MEPHHACLSAGVNTAKVLRYRAAVPRWQTRRRLSHQSGAIPVTTLDAIPGATISRRRRAEQRRECERRSGGAQNRTADLGIMSGIRDDDGEPD
jgi:hypothetical protein